MKRLIAVLSVGVLCVFLASNSAGASPITLDSFGSGSNLGVPGGLSANSSNSFSTSVTDTGLSGVFGGDRTTTLSNSSGAGDVTLSISGISGHLNYNGSNGANAAAGSFNLLYNGSFVPASFSGTGNIAIDVFKQNNPNPSSVFTVTVAGSGGSFPITESLSGHSNGTTLLFPFNFSNIGTITSINVHVSATSDTNLTLAGIQLNGSNGGGANPGGGGGGGGNVVPEPQSLFLWAALALGLAAYAAWRPLRERFALRHS